MSCPEFIAESFAVGTASRLAHLLTKSYAHHIALAEFYDAQSDLVDRYAETYLGLDNAIRSFPDARPPKGDPISLLSDYLIDIQAELAEDHDSEALKSILADLEELTARTLYKLRNLK